MSMDDITEVSPAGASCPAEEVAEEGCVSTSAASRADRFLARVDQEIATIALRGLAREHFLRRLIENWEDRYHRFILSEGVSEYCYDPADPIDVADFVLTLAGLTKRLKERTSVMKRENWFWR